MNTTPPNPAPLSIGLCAQLACVWETTARCPGNAHRFYDFPDTTYVDFLVSAAAVAPILDTAWQRPVGQTVLDAVRATRRVVARNTNLGVLLLLAPFASVLPGEKLRAGVARVLDRLDVADAQAVYEAIRLANPAGLGRVSEQDVSAEPTRPLREVMELAADRDLVARQYADSFQEVFDDGIAALTDGLERMVSLEQAVIFCHLNLMARHPDSLIARKCGAPEAEESARQAATVLRQEWPRSEEAQRSLSDLDRWLRAAGRGRNPGTTSDLVTASLFAALREGIIALPPKLPWASSGFEP